MKKLFLKIGAILLGAGLVIGSGAAIAAHRESFKAAHAATYTAYTLDGSSAAEGEGSTNGFATESVFTQNGIEWGFIGNTTLANWRIGGKKISSAVRTITSHSAVSSQSLARVKLNVSAVSNANLSVDGLKLYVGSTQGAKDVSEISKTFAAGIITFDKPAAADWSNRYFTVEFTLTNSVNSNYYVSFYSLAFEYDIETVAPDTVTVSGQSSINVGDVVQYSAQATKSGSATGVNQNVSWSSSDETKAVIDSDGNVTALNNGSVTIKAASEDDSNVYDEKVVTISNGVSSLEPITITSSSFGMTTGTYANYAGFHLHKGIVFDINDVAQQTSDYTDKDTKEVIAYEKGAFIMKKTTGTIKTYTENSANINRVVVSGISTTAPAITVCGGNVAGSETQTATLTNEGMMFYYSFETSVKYVTIKAGSNAAYINSFTFEFVGGADTASSLADFILGLIPNRDDVTGLCDGPTGNYQVAKARYVAASSTVRSDFETGTAENIVAARARYVQWAAVYGDSTPFADTISTQSALKITQETNLTLIITVISIVTVLSLAGALFIIRKRKHQ